MRRSLLNKSLVSWTDARGLDLMLVSIRRKKKEKKCTIHSCFSFWTWVDWCLSMFPFGRRSNPALDTASELAILDADFIPRAAFFAVFVPRNTCTVSQSYDFTVFQHLKDAQWLITRKGWETSWLAMAVQIDPCVPMRKRTFSYLKVSSLL